MNNRQETIERYEKISERKLPIVMGITDDYLQSTVQLLIAEAYLEGYKKGVKKYKRFKKKFVQLQMNIKKNEG